MNEVWSPSNIIVLIALSLAVFSDIKTKKVDNRFNVGILLAGILFSLTQFGFNGLWQVLSSMTAAFAIGTPLYLLRVFGGGDFKLLLAVSSFLDWKQILTVIALSFIWGSILGLFKAAMSGQLKSVAHNILSIFLKNKAHQTKLHAVPYTVAIFFGFVSMLTLFQIGWEGLI
jgi:Flp pilus assembly protein protease CpaA